VKALLCRVGADQSVDGGSWNGLVYAATGKFLYIAIPEGGQVHAGLQKPYSALAPLIGSIITLMYCALRRESLRSSCKRISTTLIFPTI
jgi:hypothetical protein